ncbi:Fusaridione A cluster transcription factor fsdR [Colletotrichum aenigma]|uniref:Fusaridione A cluster transcription factor fsdR n=1 Tax=Colletotrichum aenigma TaxID=1215731 RepID=UPI0018723109|nr:Fusaridione A cluster transcription factor fsdR [Colletotrichum aenigma]KAF5523250.1 Fusaridione A cluster transcription factor fsdR [Colletotrichum aenigma]
MASAADDAAAVEDAEEPPKKRIYSACLHCQSRKRRCDGGEPTCGLCTRLGLRCVYTQRRRRGPGKKNKPAVDAEAKVRAIETSLERMAQLHVTDGGASSSGPGRTQLPSEATLPPVTASLDDTAKDADRPAHDDLANSSRDPLPASSLPSRFPPLRDLFSGPQLLSTMRAIRSDVESRMDHSPFKRRAFTSFPPPEYLLDLEQAVIEDIQLFCPTITRKHFLELAEQQYTGGTREKTAIDDPARWAIINALFATAVQWRTANDSFEDMSPMSWGYFKNAFSVFPELLISGGGVSTVEAMLTMATFLLGTTDARTTLQVASSAARTAQMMGLHRREAYTKLDAAQSRQHRRACWVAFIVDTEMTVRFGISPSFNLGQMNADLPDEGLASFNHAIGITCAEKTQCYVRKLAELSRIRYKIHDQLSIDSIKTQAGPHHQAAVLALSAELEAWRDSFPEHLRPKLTAVVHDRELETHVVLLHIYYFDALIKIHTNLARLKSVSSHSLTLCQNPSWEASQGSCPNVQDAYEKCTAAARATVETLRVTPPHSFVHLWAMICYPVASCLILLWSALEESTGAEAHANVRVLGQFVQFLAGLREEGCDVRNLLDGCSKFFKIAKYAVHTQRTIRLTRPLDEDENVREQLETLRLKLSGVAEWTHLAQGLLSNIPTLCAQAREVFSDILESEKPGSDGYGPLASDMLKPHNHNFCFGP